MRSNLMPMENILICMTSRFQTHSYFNFLYLLKLIHKIRLEKLSFRLFYYSYSMIILGKSDLTLRDFTNTEKAVQLG